MSSRLPSFWRATTVEDRLYLGYLAVVTLVILVFRARLADWPWFLLLHAICVAGIALMVAFPRSAVLRFLHFWYPLLMFVVCFEEVARLSLMIRSGWQDRYILELEHAVFGVHPTVYLQRWISPLVTEMMEVGYFSFYVIFFIVGGVLYKRRDKSEFHRLMITLIVSYFICYAAFVLFPTEGPRRTLAALHTISFSGGPFHWMVNLIQAGGGVHGNAFPSGHIAASVICLIYALWHERRVGLMLLPFVVLMCFAAVYDRYHYASDVVAGALLGAAAAWLLRHVDVRQSLRATA